MFYFSPISVANLAELLTMLHDGTINHNLGKLILQEMLEHLDGKPSEVNFILSFQNFVGLTFLQKKNFFRVDSKH